MSSQAEGEVGLETALVKLVEDDATYAVEGRIIGHATAEDALGHNLDTRLGRYLSLETYLIAYGSAHWFVQQLCHAHGYLSGCHAAWLKNDDAAFGQCLEHGERQQRRFSGTGGRYDNGGVTLAQGSVELFRNGCGRQHACRG